MTQNKQDLEDYEDIKKHGFSGSFKDYLEYKLTYGGVFRAAVVHPEEETCSGAAVHEPAPTGDGQVILDLVRKDFEDRAAAGLEKYGTPLRAHNGRDSLMDAYQEAVDLCMYLRQAMFERDGR